MSLPAELSRPLAASLAPSRDIGQLVEWRARERPDAPAFLGLDAPDLSNQQLAKLVGATRCRLRELGVSRRDRVALVTRGGAEAATAFLSIAAEATCAPLRPVLTGAELRFALGDLAATVLVHEADLASEARDVARELGLPCLELIPHPGDGAGSFELRGSAGPAVSGLEPRTDQDTILLLHTTGSTARPKLVRFTNRSLLSAACGTGGALELEPRDRCLNFMPPFHTHGLVTGILVPLVTGGSAACLPRFEAEPFFRWLEDLRPTWYSTSPPIHHVIMREARRRGRVSHHLRFARSGSSPLPAPVAHQLEELLGVPVVEAYGLTEVCNVAGNTPRFRRPGSVGRSAGPEIAIVDSEGEALGPGARGEIAVRGPSVTPGYGLEATPSGGASAAGWFRTGDLGWLDADGFLFVAGRNNEMINRGGDNVSPAEVDRELLEIPGVEHAVAFAVPHSTLGEDVVAAAVLSRPGELSETEILRSLRRRLAPHKVPTRVLLVDEIPGGATGKPERARLAELLWKGESAAGAADDRLRGAVPETPAELFVAELWGRLLDVTTLGVDDDFFESGATSIDAAEIAERLQSILGETVHIPMLFEARTVGSLARCLEERYGAALARACGSAPPVEEDAAEPVTLSDLRVFRDHIRGDSRPPARAVGRNPRAVFLLSSPRSGSTLLRAMLAGHPGLFAPPELRLLHYDDAGDWAGAMSGSRAFMREGLLRAVMALRKTPVEEAERWLEERLARKASVQSLMAELQDLAQPRVLVEKTPLYAADPAALQRMEDWFEAPLYVHLIRHPGAVVHSYLRSRMDLVSMPDQPFTARKLAELLWIESHHNVLELQQDIPSDRLIRIRYESLVEQPQATLRDVCRFIGVDYDARMLTPYADPEVRMLDAARPRSRAIGDPRFLDHAGIDAGLAEAWRSEFDEMSLGGAAAQLAARLGYAVGTESGQPPEPAEQPQADEHLLRRGVARIGREALAALGLKGRWSSPAHVSSLARLSTVVRGWRGTRQHPDALIVGKNTAGGSRPLFWCFQGESELRALGERLAPERPLYGMRSPFAVLVRGRDDIGLVAQRYAREIRAIEPEGPYLIGGNCTGARLAFDVAWELMRSGGEVALLFLMEAFIDGDTRGGWRCCTEPWARDATPTARWRTRRRPGRVATGATRSTSSGGGTLTSSSRLTSVTLRRPSRRGWNRRRDLGCRRRESLLDLSLGGIGVSFSRGAPRTGGRRSRSSSFN